MKAVIRDVWRVFLLKAGPRVFPRSWPLLAGIAALFLVTDVLSYWLQSHALRQALEQSVMEMGLQVLLVALFLAAKQRLIGMNPALIAWFGAGIILNLLSLPLALGDRLLPAATAAWLLPVPSVLLVTWSIMVLSYIFQDALDIGPINSFGTSCVCVLATIVTLSELFPV